MELLVANSAENLSLSQDVLCVEQAPTVSRLGMLEVYLICFPHLVLFCLHKNAFA